MHEIKLDSKVLGYEKDAREITKYMLEDVSITDVSFDGGKRVMRYENGQVMTIEKIEKEFGTQSGDICSICKKGILTEYGGCATCANCGAQIKCGL